MLDWLTAKFGRPARAVVCTPAPAPPIALLNYQLRYSIPLYVDIVAHDTDGAGDYAALFLREFIKEHPGTELRSIYRADLITKPTAEPPPDSPAPSTPLPPPAAARRQENSK